MKYLMKLNIFSLRGIFVFLCVSYLYFLPARQHNDIIAYVFSICFFVFLLSILILIFAFGNVLRRSCRISIGHFLRSAHPHSSELISLNIGTTPIRIPPLCILNIKLIFKGDDQDFIAIPVRGFRKSKHSLTVERSFSHRGLWSLDKIDYSLTDVFGLVRMNWSRADFESMPALTIYPPTQRQEGIPVISSSIREGDVLQYPQQHSGDYYDIRRYQPADGARRILWKIYAKSGNLMSRHPEESVSPEGQTLIFCTALQRDDILAGACVDYIKSLEQMDVQVLCDCLGSKIDQLAQSSYEMLDLLVESAWQAGSVLDAKKFAKNADDFLKSAGQRMGTSKITKLCLFVSDSLMRDPHNVAACRQVGSFVSGLGVIPVFCVLSTFRQFQTGNNLNRSPWRRILPYLVDSEKPPQSNASYEQFLVEACNQNNWECFSGSVY